MEFDDNKYAHLFDIKTEGVEELLKKLQVDSGSFKESTVLITGGARGIGRHTAIGLGSLGANVVVIDKLKSGQETADIINNEGKGKALFIHTDISSRDNIRNSFEEVRNAFGHVDVLINNAVHFSIHSFQEISQEEWDLHQRTNIDAMVLYAKLVLPGMLERKNGCIMNMVALEGMAFAAAMSSSKVAMRSLLFSMASEIPKESGVHIMGFAPGLVATPLVKDVFFQHCNKMGVDFEDYVTKINHNPGYEGLMPVEHCAASLIYSLATAKEYHGLIADPFYSLRKHGIISNTSSKKGLGKVKNFPNNIRRVSDYIKEVVNLNHSIEQKIEQRTAILNQEKQTILDLLGQIEAKNRELELIRDELIIAKEEVEEASLHKEVFFTNVTHEIRTPLNAIIGFIDLLHDTDLNKEQKEHLNAIQISGENLLRLVNEVLDISKISAGKLQLTYESFSVGTLLNNLKRTNEAKAADKNITISVDIEQNIPEFIFGDSVRLYQILLNLLGNAIKFTMDGEVILSVAKIWEDRDEVKLAIKVIDNGFGIPEANLKTIFETFTQVKNQRDRDFGGSGLGLAIVKQLVSLQGGTIDVESEEGVGTTFTVGIVYAKSEEGPKSKEKIVSHKDELKGLNILLAEDNVFNQKLEKTLLEKAGAKVTVAENGVEVLDFLKKDNFDIILMDVQMPKMDGISATKIIRTDLHLGIPIVALTANAFKQELQRCITAGMNDFISKPFKKERLIEVIRTQVKKAAVHK